MNPTETLALEIRGLLKKFPKFVLGELSLSVPAGSITALLGANGAGKTTLLNLIFGVGAPQAGEIRVFERDHAGDDVAVKKMAGFAGPELDFSAWGTVGGALEFLAAFRPSWDGAYERNLLENFGLLPRKRIQSLSLGERTQLGLVAALAWRPRLLVLDEPTTGLDVRARQFLLKELLSVVIEPDRAVFLSSHQLSDVERIADRLVLLKGGRVMVEGEVARLLESYTWAQWSAPTEALFAGVTGVFALQSEGGRWRAVLDRNVCPPERLGQLGATQLHTQPLSLEELFLALTALA